MQAIRFGLDVAKTVFQVHGVDAAEQVVVQRRLRRGQLLAFFARQEPALIGIEACGSAHHWARELTVLGHEVRLIPPASMPIKAGSCRAKNVSSCPRRKRRATTTSSAASTPCT